MPTQIPLTTDPESTFRIELESRQIDFRVIYNTRKERWSADISENGISLLGGLSLVLGTDILRGQNSEIGALVMVDTENAHREATTESLGDAVILLHYTEAELEAQNG